MTTTTGTTSTGPAALRSRALGPDLARGLLLLFIALANVRTLLHPPGVDTLRGTPIATDLPDRIVAFLGVVLVDGRSYTLFAGLLGYGLVQIARRRPDEDWPATRKLLRRRGRWLMVFGFLHAALLFMGDILAAYGLLTLILVVSLRWSSRRLLAHAAGWMVAGSLLYGVLATPTSAATTLRTMPWLTEANPLIAMVMRSGAILLSAPALAVTAVGAFLLGIWAAKQRLLEEPARSERLLRRTATIGLTVSVLGGIPLALFSSGILPDPVVGAVIPASVLHSLTGFAGGPAYAALVALWALRLGDRPGRVVTALQATGQRSLTSYVSQSVVWSIAFAPYLLDLGPRLALWQAVLLAVGTWVLTVVVADWMGRRGYRGPLEVLLRKLTYR